MPEQVCGLFPLEKQVNQEKYWMVFLLKFSLSRLPAGLYKPVLLNWQACYFFLLLSLIFFPPEFTHIVFALEIKLLFKLW
uniref:Uncharacterized protein n=1 Tax=Arundo donax TaxID=35708 RepID=A0A0A9H4X3_ARUDO